MKIFGILLAIVGVIGLMNFINMDTSVAVEPQYYMGEQVTPGGRVNNLGLMNEKQNRIILFIGITIVGAIFFGIGSKKNEKVDSSTDSAKSEGDITAASEYYCDKCKGTVKESDKFCPHCGDDISVLEDENGLFCKICKTMNLPDAAFCSNCGKPHKSQEVKQSL